MVNEIKNAFYELLPGLKQKDLFNDIKLVIVMRTDLNMRKGKMAAQAGHAASAFLINSIVGWQDSTMSVGNNVFSSTEINISIPQKSKKILSWIKGNHKKIVLGIESEEKLLDLHRKAVEAGLMSFVIEDSGLTEFKKPTITCIAIGPDHSDKINLLTENLKLL